MKPEFKKYFPIKINNVKYMCVDQAHILHYIVEIKKNNKKIYKNIEMVDGECFYPYQLHIKALYEIFNSYKIDIMDVNAYIEDDIFSPIILVKRYIKNIKKYKSKTIIDIIDHDNTIMQKNLCIECEIKDFYKIYNEIGSTV